MEKRTHRHLTRNRQRFLLTVIIAVATGLLSAAIGPGFAADGGTPAGGGMPRDWSNRHVLFPNPDTRDEAAGKGTVAFAQWKKKLEDPRFALQVARKTNFVQARGQNPFSDQQLQWAGRFDRRQPHAGPPIHRDWSVALGTGGYGQAGTYPAKFGFDINAAPSCTNDFVVFPTTGTGAVASGSGSFTGAPAAGETVTVTNTNTGQSIVLTVCTGVSPCNTGLTFKRSTNTTTVATNLASAIARNGASVAVTATSAAAVVTVTAVDNGASGNSITLASALTNFSWGTSSLTGGSDPPTTRPTIEAFNNLYNTTCTGTVPATYWAFNTGAAFTETSPVLSLDGKQVAFIQRGGANGQASLVLLKWAAGSGSIASPTALSSQASGAAYRSCTAPCMLAIAFGNGAPNTNSSPFYDYAGDILYVGDKFGALHKFTGVFNGTPAEVTGAPWPVSVSAGNLLSSPVYDWNSGLIFVGSAAGETTGGQLHSVDAANGTVVTSGLLVTANTAGVHDAPIVDSNAGRVYAFVGTDATLGTNCTAAPCLSVYQFPTGFSGGSTGTSYFVGRGIASATSGFLFAGAFDNDYYTSVDPANPTGNLYVCGSVAGNASRPALWRIPVTANVMGAPVQGPRLTSNTGTLDCSGITEVMNGTNDYIYVSVAASGNDTGCSGSCIYVYNLTGIVWAPARSAVAGLAAAGGTGGIIVDNISSATGASQIYYSTLANPGNAVQASQAALN